MYRCTGVLNYRGCFCGLSLRLPYTRSSHYCACSLSVIKYRLAKNATIIYHCTPNEFVEKNPENVLQYGSVSSTKSNEKHRRKTTYFRQVEEGLFQEVLGGADVLGDGVGGVVAAAEARPLLGTQASPGVAATRVGA